MTRQRSDLKIGTADGHGYTRMVEKCQQSSGISVSIRVHPRFFPIFMARGNPYGAWASVSMEIEFLMTEANI
jgi:hypothetical protein